MIIDFTELYTTPAAGHYDVCIAGGGVAGITLALALGEAGKRVLLLEAGGLEYSEESQKHYQGKNVGRDYFDLDVTRLRFLGGTSNHWGGWCRPLDASDFLQKPYIDMSGWPIGKSDLDPYVAEACRLLEIDPFLDDAVIDGTAGMLKEVSFRYSPPVRFGEKYFTQLRDSRFIDVFLNSNLIDIELDQKTNRISGFLFCGYGEANGSRRASADHYILALGGIENVRMLLNSNNQISTGLGNGGDLVGRYFMEHLHHDVGYYIANETDQSLGVTQKFIAPTDQMQKLMEIANAGFRLNPLEQWSIKKQVKDVLCYTDIIADLARTLRGRLNCLSSPVSAGSFRVASEQTPNWSSRITLSSEVDEFKLRKVQLDWQLSPLDKKTIKIGAEYTARYFAQSDIGRVKIFDWLLDENESGIPGMAEGQEAGGHHHMGTTRMGRSEMDGVVDRDSKVFGLANLFVTGSSVFCTSGHANPTFTIVQLALRLAHRIVKTK